MTKNYWANVLQGRVKRRRVLGMAGGAAFSAAFLAACGSDDDDAGSTGSSASTGSTGSTTGGSGGNDAGGADSSGLLSERKDTSAQARRGGTLKLSVERDVAAFDVAIAQRYFEVPQSHVYSRLTQQKAAVLGNWTGEFTGDIAESWEFSPDGLTLTMKLRPGVVFHNKPPVNGRALDVDDVVFSWDRFEAKGGDSANIANSVNPDAPIESITATDDQTIVVKSKYPNALLIAILGQYLLGHITILPKETDSTFDIRQDAIGTGPFFLSEYQASQGYTFERHPDYYDKDRPYVDKVEMPILTEYSTGLSQLKAGNLHYYPVNGEDIIQTKNDVSDILMYESSIAVATAQTIFGWLPAGESPFLDERVRQAYSMALDRDLFIDTFYNVSKFEAAGLPMETRWNTSFPATFDGWWLDPKGDEFGENAKYFAQNIEEAKALLAAAGYPDGLDVTSNVNAVGYGGLHVSQAEVLDGMASEVGFRPVTNSVENYTADFIPKFRDSKGNYEGWSFKLGPVYANDPLAHLMYRYYSKGGVAFFGFDSAGKSDNSGDPELDAMMEKARGELDTEARRKMVFDIQRYLAKSMYGVWWPGGASTFNLAWAAVQNVEVFRGDNRAGGYSSIAGNSFNWWLDDTKPPLA